MIGLNHLSRLPGGTQRLVPYLGVMLTTLIVLITVQACGNSTAPTPSRQETTISVNKVERVFITRPFGGPLSAVLAYLEFEPTLPAALSVEALGNDGQLYRGAWPDDSKICGLPAYLGLGLEAGREGNRRTLAFIVPDYVSLVELQWRSDGQASPASIPLGNEAVVCTPAEWEG